MRRRRSNPVQCQFWTVHSRMKKKILALLSNVVLSAWKVSFSPSLYNSLPLSLSLSLSLTVTHTHTHTDRVSTLHENFDKEW
jgi:hypothetical protein